MKVPAWVRDAQERLAFRLAVRACLEVYYGQSVAESHANADAWWGRISKTAAFKSGFFMHAEPINTAGRIADRPIVALNDGNRKAYEELLEDCWKVAHESVDLDGQSHGRAGEVAPTSGVVFKVKTSSSVRPSGTKAGRGKLVAAERLTAAGS